MRVPFTGWGDLAIFALLKVVAALMYGFALLGAGIAGAAIVEATGSGWLGSLGAAAVAGVMVFVISKRTERTRREARGQGGGT